MTFDVKNERNGAVLASEASLANTFWTRFRGLSGRPTLPPGQGLLIVPCNSVHCFGMKFAIDVAYLTAEGTVLQVVTDLAPGRIGPIVKGAKAVIELPAGTLAATDTRAGDRLAIGTAW